MQNKSELIEHFVLTRNQLRELLPKIDIHMEIYPGWTIKEVLAHLTGWDDAIIIALQMFAAGQPPLMTAARGINFYNSQTVAERKELTLEQIIREWEWVREQLIPIVHALTDKELAATLVAPWGVSMSVLDLLHVIVHHENEHTEVIKTRIADPHQPPTEH